MTAVDAANALEPREIAYLIKKCEGDRAINVRSCGNAATHGAINERDRTARQIELLDELIAKLRGLAATAESGL